MNNYSSILRTANLVFANQAEAINNMSSILDDNFLSAIKLINNSNGKLIITGIGKSAIIAMKISATLNSTGTKSVFIHASDALHGDSGIIDNNDVVLFISKSGSTKEIKNLVGIVKSNGNKTIALTSNKKSFLSNEADIVLNIDIKKEADPYNLVPTTSTTTQLVLGDTIAICLMKLNEFKENDFAKFHPSGSLGKMLSLKIKQLVSNDKRPNVKIDSKISDIITEITTKLVGATAVIEDEKVIGIITDGDVRRIIEKNKNLSSITAKNIMNSNPKKVQCDILAKHALEILRNNNINQIIVEDKKKYIGIVHIHDILKEGIL